MKSRFEPAADSSRTGVRTSSANAPWNSGSYCAAPMLHRDAP